jgi:SAM-dependent methyltransferase
MTDEEAPPGIDMSKYFVLPSQEVTLPEIDNRGGWILDVGGGGEGIIGLLKGKDVIAIDKRMDELEETSNDALKVVMDAKDLKFIDESFTIATLYFTLMYIPDSDFEDIFKELWRVLIPGGEVHIWDAILQIPPEEKGKERFVIFLKTNFPDGRENQTGYGGLMRVQHPELFLKPAQKVGFKVIDQKVSDFHFYVKLGKP